MSVRRIIYITGTRADYGLMREALLQIDKAPELELSVCITGMHLSKLYGNTIQEIEADKFRICGQIPVDVENTTHASMAKSIGYEIIGFTEVFERERPDVILLLGDRGEVLAAAIAAVHLNIPVVHLHGGERSGTVDEMVRHAISKLSHYHFVATESSRNRLIKMGESEDKVFTIGAPGLDRLHLERQLTRDEFYKKYCFVSDKKCALLIYHPVVQEYQLMKHQFEQVLQAAFASNLQIICLEPNSDAGGQFIREVIQKYANHPNLRVITHLARPEFIDCLANVDVMLGNSSSGIIEAASFNLVVVNVGTRQNLRERSQNVIDAREDYESIKRGIETGLNIPKKSYINVYGDGKTSERCAHLLKTISLDPGILNKCNEY